METYKGVKKAGGSDARLAAYKTSGDIEDIYIEDWWVGKKKIKNMVPEIDKKGLPTGNEVWDGSWVANPKYPQAKIDKRVQFNDEMKVKASYEAIHQATPKKQKTTDLVMDDMLLSDDPLGIA